MNSQQCDYVIDLNNGNTMARHAITSYSYERSKFAYTTKYVKCTDESIYLEIYVLDFRLFETKRVHV